MTAIRLVAFRILMVVVAGVAATVIGCRGAAPQGDRGDAAGLLPDGDTGDGSSEDSQGDLTGPPSASDGTVVPPGMSSKPRILVSIVMHVEEPPGYPDFENDETVFFEHRGALLEFAEMLASNGVTFNYQSDWNFLKAVARYDSGTPETNGKNIVRYLVEDLGFEVNPHAHETRYNYADVAYLVEQLGAPQQPVVGGFIADPPNRSILEQFWAPIQGDEYPDYEWEPTVLWGGGTGNHVNEEMMWVSGVWKPKDRGHFLEHDDAAPLPNIGNFGGTWSNLDLLLRCGTRTC